MSDAGTATSPRPLLQRFGYSALWTVAVLAFAIAAIFIGRQSKSTPDTTAEDVASAWNEGIARLGILPLYPPSDDFYVGDVWAVIADAPAPDGSAVGQLSSPGKSTLLGKSVRIGYIDLRKEMQADRQGQPLFDETPKDYRVGDALHPENLVEVDNRPSDAKISLSLAAFPGVTITHKLNATASLGWSLGSLGLSSDDRQLEQIRIPKRKHMARRLGRPLFAWRSGAPLKKQ